MTLLNRLLVGTDIGGVQVVAVYDPFFDNIEIEVNGRLWSSVERRQCIQYRSCAETFANDLHFLLIDRYNFETDAAYTKLQSCLSNIAKYCR